MATLYSTAMPSTSTIAPAYRQRRTSPLPLPEGGAGGGALDPSGLVPVNRVQPVAGTIDEVQRLTENRLGTMPPSSFAGAGNAFVPVDRPSAPIYRTAVEATDAGPQTIAVGEPAPMSPDAYGDLKRQALYGGQPYSPPATPTVAQNAFNQFTQMTRSSADRRAERRTAMLARLQQRMPPEAFARLQAALARNDAARAAMRNPDVQPGSMAPGYTPPPPTATDRIRQALAARGMTVDQLPPQWQGLLGVAG